MPQQELAYRTQTAVLWETKGGGYHGEPPVNEYGEVLINVYQEIRVRWETGRRKALNPQGGTVSLDAQAFVSQEIRIGSIMWLGKYDDWLGTGSGATDAELMQVATYEEIPDVKGRAVARVVGLMKYKSDLPVIG